MSRNPNLQTDEFVVVRYKRKRAPKRDPRCKPTDDTDFEFDRSTLINTITSYKEEISRSDLHASVVAAVKEALGSLIGSDVEEIVCLGLGHISERIVARYQLALLLCLKDDFKTTVRVQDPAFSQSEIQFLQDVGLKVVRGNLEGKFRAQNNSSTVFYLPHCPKQLTNNILWANWGPQLTNCVLICNSFSNVIESTSKHRLADCEYFARISDSVLEIAIINTFKYFEVFNDTAVHIFPPERLVLLPEDFWERSTEPTYSTDVEFIRSSCG